MTYRCSKNIYNYFSNFIQKSWFVSVLMATFLYITNINGKTVNMLISQYAPELNLRKFAKAKIKFDMHFCRLFYKVNYREYFMFVFPKLNKKGRKDFIGIFEWHDILAKINPAESMALFDDKYKTYQKFREYYKRDVVKISSKEDYPIFDEFIKSHNVFLVKAINLDGGRGIYAVNTKDKDFSSERLFADILKQGEALLEERIIQSSEIAEFHPESVNTLRAVTYNENENIRIFFTLMRFGRGAMIVDNGLAGGILASVDTETGIIDTAGWDENLGKYLIHPDTCKQIIGFKVPHWIEAKELCIKLASVIPSHKLVGWDLALTDKGWIMVEGNGKPLCEGKQITTKQGLRNIVKI